VAAEPSPAEPASQIPGDEDAERDLLGACFIHPRAWTEASQYLRGADLESAQHHRIFEACGLIAQANDGAVTFTLLAPTLRAMGRQEDDVREDVAYATRCIDACWDASRVGDVARTVAGFAVRRRLIRAGGAVADASYDQADPKEALAVAYRTLDAVRDSWLGGERVRYGAQEFTPAMLGALDGEAERAPGVPTGLPRVDALTGGLRPGELTVLAARTGHGKTALACQVSLHALLAGRRVLIATAEMTPEELLYRMLAMRTGTEASRLARGASLTDDEVARAAGEIGVLDGLGLSFLWKATGLDLQTVEREAERAALVGEADVVVVDYLQLVRLGRRTDNRVVEVGEVAMACKRLAQRLRVPVLGLAQLNRQVEQRRDPRPQLSDLRESGALEQAADAVWLLFRPALFGKADDGPQASDDAAGLIVAKNRAGATGFEPLTFDGPTTSFRPLDEWHRT